MKKPVFIVLLINLLIVDYIAHAQQIAIGVRGGLSIPNLTSSGSNQNPLNTGYSSRLGGDAGLFAEFKFSELFSLQPMLEYSSQGGKKNGFQALPIPDQLAALFPPGQAPPYLYANFKSEAKLKYLMIPVLAKFGWNFNESSPLRVYVDAGPFVGFLLSAKQVTSGNSPLYADSGGQQELPGGSQSFDNTEDIKDQLHKTNFGVEGNVGLNYSIGHTSNLFLEGGFNYGFFNIQKGTANGKNNTGAATVMIGYSYWFSK